MNPELTIDPFVVQNWLRVFRDPRFKFVWGVHGGPNWYRQLQGNSVDKCAALGVLKLFETQFRTGPGATRINLPAFCPARREGNWDYNHDVLPNLDHVRYMILRHRLLVAVAIRRDKNVEPSSILDALIAMDPAFQ